MSEMLSVGGSLSATSPLRSPVEFVADELDAAVEPKRPDIAGMWDMGAREKAGDGGSWQANAPGKLSDLALLRASFGPYDLFRMVVEIAAGPGSEKGSRLWYGTNSRLTISRWKKHVFVVIKSSSATYRRLAPHTARRHVSRAIPTGSHNPSHNPVGACDWRGALLDLTLGKEHPYLTTAALSHLPGLNTSVAGRHIYEGRQKRQK